MSTNYWGVLWRYENKLDGKRSHLLHENGLPVVFRTRRRAIDHIKDKFGYLHMRPDLKAEPHGWKMPVPIKITIRPMA